MAQGRSGRRVIRTVDTWSVLKFSVLLYGSLLVVALVASILLWMVAVSVGVIDNFEDFVLELLALQTFSLSPVRLFSGLAVGGLMLVVLGTGVNVLVAVLYNLASDIVGGIEVTVVEEEPGQPLRRSMV
jgi:hypothetical protein